MTIYAGGPGAGPGLDRNLARVEAIIARLRAAHASRQTDAPRVYDLSVYAR